MIKKAIALIASLTLAGSISAADLKIAVVDMNKAFAEYYKTKTAAGKLQDNVNKVKEELNERWAAYKKLMEEAEKLDKARFRRALGNVIESYTEVARRLGIMKDMPTVIQGGLH